MMKWQPIETAPKDGTFILLCGGMTDEDDYDNSGVDRTRPVVGFYNSQAVEDYLLMPNQGWAFSFWDGSWRTYYDDPTHWMPLPSPPKE